MVIFVTILIPIAMPPILSCQGISPQLGTGCFIAENATLIGDLTCGDLCSFWFQSVVRADVNSITMGHRVNVQDGAIIHCTYEKAATVIGNDVSIGHRAIVHGCTLHDRVLVGMGSIIMDGAVVHSDSIIAAGAVVLEGTVVESGSVYAGVPAKKVKDITKELLADQVTRIAKNYILYSNWFR
jgi:carbonic anhydrase/acetyltransferase-like protein (isoleucine patch superfamily)